MIRVLSVLLGLALVAAPAAAQPRTARLLVTVHDPSGAVIPGAVVTLTGPEGAQASVAAGPVESDTAGVAVAAGLRPGRYGLRVEFPGFDPLVIPEVRLRAGDTRRDVTLTIPKVDESVSVGRDPATAASDPDSERFGNVLSREQIDALPDDPDEMEAQLKEMAGPGATIRVDGFRGGKLPPKSQIRSIRFASGLFAAENHASGLVMIDIVTQPGLGPMRGSIDFNFRDGVLNARNAFQGRKGPEQTQQYTLNLGGTLVRNRTSFALSAGGASLYDSASVFAALPAGPRTAEFRRPSDRLNLTARVDHALTRSHTLRASYQRSGLDQENLGVGSFDLGDRAYSRTSTDSLFRVSESGPLARAWFGESRLQLHWTSADSVSAVEAPTIQVLDAFTSGGAQQAGGRSARELEWATNVDWAHRRHAVKMGTLVEGGVYRSDLRTNYLGTYTFPTLADYQAGQPATFTRRAGDPLVEFSQWQAGIFVQDDWRVRQNLTVSGGVREEFQSHMDDRWNLAPRAGLTWSPFKHGKTSIRAGAGIFHDWLDADTFEQTLRVDGTRQQDLLVIDPAYPATGDGLGGESVPPGRYLLGDRLTMPARTMMMAGVSQQLSPTMTLNVTFNHSEGRNRLRGRNLNAPVDGVRPDSALGNVTAVESTGRTRGDSLNAGISMMLPKRRTFLFANYGWLRQRNDADGPFSVPADGYDVAGEWGPAAGVPSHVASALFNTTLPRGIRVGLSTTARSGIPYNVTTGRDDNGDGVFVDRPAGVGRNSRRSAGMWDVAARVSYAFGFGQRAQSGGAGGPQVIMVRAGGGAGDMLGGVSGGAEDRRVRIELFVAASNVFNTVNPMGYSGVMTSPFFGRPTAAGPARKLDLGLKVGF
jgi:hypothetical protein